MNSTMDEIIPSRREDVDRERVRDAAEELLAACRLGAEYDDLLRQYCGPMLVLWCDDAPKIDAAYDRWIAATRTAIALATGERP